MDKNHEIYKNINHKNIYRQTIAKFTAENLERRGLMMRIKCVLKKEKVTFQASMSYKQTDTIKNLKTTNDKNCTKIR